MPVLTPRDPAYKGDAVFLGVAINPVCANPFYNGEHHYSFKMRFQDIYQGENSFVPLNVSLPNANISFLNIKHGDWLYMYAVDDKIIEVWTYNNQRIYMVYGHMRHIKGWDYDFKRLLATDRNSPFKKPDVIFPINNLAVKKGLPRSILGEVFKPWTSYIIGIAGVIERSSQDNKYGISLTNYSTHLRVFEIGKPQINPIISEYIAGDSATNLQSQHLVAVFFQGDKPMVVFDLSTNQLNFLSQAAQRPFYSQDRAFLDQASRYELAAIPEIQKIAMAHAQEFLSGGGLQQNPYV